MCTIRTRPEHEHPGEGEHAGDNDISVAEMRGGKSTLADFDLKPSSEPVD